MYLSCFSASTRPEATETVLPVPAESVGGSTVGSAWAVTIELTEELWATQNENKNRENQI